MRNNTVRRHSRFEVAGPSKRVLLRELSLLVGLYACAIRQTQRQYEQGRFVCCVASTLTGQYVTRLSFEAAANIDSVCLSTVGIQQDSGDTASRNEQKFNDSRHFTACTSMASATASTVVTGMGSECTRKCKRKRMFTVHGVVLWG